MTTPDVFLGIDWAEPDRPVIRTAPVGARAAAIRPLLHPLCFRIVDAPAYCVGWFDLTGPTPAHVVCDGWEQLERGAQCRRCQYHEGFATVHHAHRNKPTELPANVQRYLAQPHRVYLDIFADQTTKVGTVAQSRLASRLAEQGPAAARYIATATNGTAARAYEAAVSEQLGLPQAVPTTRKLKALTGAVDVIMLAQRLDERIIDAFETLAKLAEACPGVEIIDTPEQWAVPPAASAAFTLAPVHPYPARLDRGDHSLYLRGAAGPIGVFAVTDDPAADLFADNLAALRGRSLLFGDYRSTLAPTQAALF